MATLSVRESRRRDPGRSAAARVRPQRCSIASSSDGPRRGVSITAIYVSLLIYKTAISSNKTFQEIDMTSDPGTPTLDQLRVFLTVVDVGSFAGAARKLGRATSVISYSIANLEAQLGLALFDRRSTRKPQLTDAGHTVVSEARTITNGVNGLRAKVRG